MGHYVLRFQEIDRTQVAVVGGKGAHLGELSRIEGVRVPDGFCVTTAAFQRIMSEAPSLDERLDRLSRLKPDDREAISALSAEIRYTIEGVNVPDDLAAAINRPLFGLAELGRRIEAHFGRPQDIEWCLVDDDFQTAQSRPITTLFPIPEAGDRENHVYISVGQALLEEAERLVEARVLREKEDIFHLRFEELQEVVRTSRDRRGAGPHHP